MEALPLLEFAYNNSKHSSTGVTPFVANEGRSLMVPATLLLPASCASGKEPKTYAEKLEVAMRRIHEIVVEQGRKGDEQNKRREDEKRGHLSFQARDEVMCQRFRLATNKGEVRKQDFKYDGPFIIEEMVNQGVARLQGLPRGAPIAINTQFLRKYHRLPGADEYRTDSPPLKPIGIRREAEWEVEDILQQRTRGKQKEFLLKWKGISQVNIGGA